ncbi:hypothetical protein SDC9_210364 [bioreactor metagenome]|uniref:Uncharacterized protein n=1 Tax=bioreactor metagenome TaxID=1076179 RepID=A0A645JHB2_9ZZZZ
MRNIQHIVAVDRLQAAARKAQHLAQLVAVNVTDALQPRLHDLFKRARFGVGAKHVFVVIHLFYGARLCAGIFDDRDGHVGL